MVLNQQRGVRIPIQLLERFLVRARRELRLRPDSFTVCLVTNAAIARWNRSYRGKNRATDVLSFPAEETPSKTRNSKFEMAGWRLQPRESRAGKRDLSAPSRARQTRGKFQNARDSGRDDRRRVRTRIARSDEYLGDIAIAPRVAQKNAREFGRRFDEELRILALHGVLHLMGYDHETDSGQMERRERRLRRALKLA